MKQNSNRIFLNEAKSVKNKNTEKRLWLLKKSFLDDELSQGPLMSNYRVTHKDMKIYSFFLVSYLKFVGGTFEWWISRLRISHSKVSSSVHFILLFLHINLIILRLYGMKYLDLRWYIFS